MAEVALDAGRARDGSLRALQIVQANPAAGRAVATEARARAIAERDWVAASIAEEALGLAAKESDDLDRAIEHLRAAVRVATAHSLPRRAAQARETLALALAFGGRNTAALRELAAAAAVLDGREAARIEMRRGTIFQRVGRFDEALECYRRALPVLRRTHDLAGEARLLCNRGVIHTYRGAFQAAERDLLRAEHIHLAMGHELAAAQVRSNLGFVAGRKGDVPAALTWFDRADDYFRRHGTGGRAIVLLDRCEVLLSVRLTAEARRAADEAVAHLAEAKMAADLAEARLALSQAALLDGDPVAARRQAEQARRTFARQGRSSWAALARHVALRAAWAEGRRDPAMVRSACQAATALGASGFAVAALDARLMAARIALEAGRVGLARQELSLASRARRRGPAELRARAWHAEALLRLARGDRRGAERALRAGMRVLLLHQLTLGATELRAHVSGHAGDLAALGLRLAVEDGEPRRVLRWAERWRASALRLRPARPPDDAALAAELATLRRLACEIDEAALAGQDTSRLLRRLAAVEQSIRRRTHRVPGLRGPNAQDSLRGPNAPDSLRGPNAHDSLRGPNAHDSLRGPNAPDSLRGPNAGDSVDGSTGSAYGDLDTGSGELSLPGLEQTLGERALLELVELDGQLLAVVLVCGKASLHHLGRPAAVAAELDNLRFALRRLALKAGSPASLAAAVASAQYAAKRLDALLVEPAAARLGDRPLVIVPTGILHGIPWSVLPSLASRTVSVAPSAAFFCRAAGSARPAVDGPVVLVAGPGLPHAEAEIDSLARAYPGSTRLVGLDATAQAVTRAIDGAALAHIAAHGAFRADNPLFSSLKLADGPLTVYDLEGLERTPPTLVLSACDSGLSGVYSGDELMGLAAALFALGTGALVASVVPVPDDAARELMVAFHRYLQAGLSPASALALAQADGGGSIAAGSAGFVCFGA